MDTGDGIYKAVKLIVKVFLLIIFGPIVLVLLFAVLYGLLQYFGVNLS